MTFGHPDDEFEILIEIVKIHEESEEQIAGIECISKGGVHTE